MAEVVCGHYIASIQTIKLRLFCALILKSSFAKMYFKEFICQTVTLPLECVAERAGFNRYIFFILELLLLQELQDDSSSDSSMEFLSLEGDLLDDDITFMTVSTDNEDDDDDNNMEVDDDGDFNMVSRAIIATINFAKYIYTPIVDETINFDAPPLQIVDLDESKCLGFPFP